STAQLRRRQKKLRSITSVSPTRGLHAARQPEECNAMFRIRSPPFASCSLAPSHSSSTDAQLARGSPQDALYDTVRLAGERNWVACQREQGVAIDVLLEMIGQFIEGRVDPGFVVERRCRRADPLQPAPALAIPAEQAVDVATGNASIGADAAVGPA